MSTDRGRPRPAGVPATANWYEDAAQWVSAERDAAGELHGVVCAWSETGAELLRQQYRHGRRHGGFRRSHLDGTVIKLGRYFDDRLDGLLISRTTPALGPYALRECCVPDQASTLLQEYRSGVPLFECFFDANDRQVLEDGGEAPPRPPQVASNAVYDEKSRAFREPARDRAGDVDRLPCTFWPLREPLDPTSEPATIFVEQRLEDVQHACRLLIARITQVQSALAAARDASPAPVLPPRVATLLEEPFPVARRFEFEAEDEDGRVRVVVDETLRLEALDEDALVQRARLDWSALCWVCWAIGLDAVAVPTALHPRADVERALRTVAARLERLDRGEALTSGEAIEHFPLAGEAAEWLPASELAVLAEHYREARAALLFLVDGSCRSLWQDDLRPR